MKKRTVKRPILKKGDYVRFVDSGDIAGRVIDSFPHNFGSATVIIDWSGDRETILTEDLRAVPKPKDFFVEENMIEDYDIRIINGDLTVGCTNISFETVEKIYKEMKAQRAHIARLKAKRPALKSKKK